MNVSFDWGAVIVAGIGAIGSLFMLKNEVKWIKESVQKLEKSISKAHSRIDDMAMGRMLHSEQSRRVERELAE